VLWTHDTSFFDAAIALEQIANSVYPVRRDIVYSLLARTGSCWVGAKVELGKSLSVC
jgi:hypothetical protein